MLNEQDKKVLFQQIHKLWILPELRKRFGDAGPPAGFQVREALIKLPHSSPPIVEFNDEIKFILKAKMVDGQKFTQGDAVYLHEIEDVEFVEAPTLNGARVAFVYLFWSGHVYNVIFDYSPNAPDFETNEDFTLGTLIANHVRNKMIEYSVRVSQNTAEKLHTVGLWTATALLPYPITKIVERIGAGNLEEARAVLVQYCDNDFLATLVDTWRPITAFDSRVAFFNDALFCHRSQRYHGSISILVGRVEGVISDWLYDVNYYSHDKKRSLPNKVQDLRQVLTKTPDLPWAYKESCDWMLRFLESEPWLQKFTLWNQKIDTSFPGRHVVQHDKYDRAIYTQENSIKLFLLLDTICQFMMFYEVRVLGRDLSQDEGENH